jgi:hypothetical protein
VANQRLYASIGYDETGRGTEAGYDRVFMVVLDTTSARSE